MISYSLARKLRAWVNGCSIEFGLCRLLKAPAVFDTLIPVTVGYPLPVKEGAVFSQEQVKPFILHPVQMVRDFAAGYFHNHNYQPCDLMEWILKAVSNYDASKCVRLLTASHEFKINNNQLNTILNMLKDIPQKIENTLLRKQFEWLLLRGSANFLQGSADTLLNTCNLTSLNRRIISRFAGLPQIDFNTLYDELNRAARSPNILIGFDNEDYFYGRFIGYQLGLIVDESSFEEIVELCLDSKIYDGWLSILLHETIRSAAFDIDLTPFLQFLQRTPDPEAPIDAVADTVIFTINAIGDHWLVKDMFRRFHRANFLFILRCLEAIDSVKHESVVDLCLDYLQKAQNYEHRALLYRILAGLLCADYLPVLEKAAKEHDYDSNYFGLEEMLTTVRVILSGDCNGESEYSKKAARISVRHEAQEEQMQKDMLDFYTEDE